MTNARNSPASKVCRLTGTPFTSSLAPSSRNLSDLFSGSFIDTEFVGLNGDISPLAQLYVINSPNSDGAGKAGVAKRVSLRGAFALISPASHVAFDEGQALAVDQPLLDNGGRFANTLYRVTTTTQEFTLFQQISRRIIAELWLSIKPDEQLPLPYLGAITLTHNQRQTIKQLLPKLKQLFTDVVLQVYPFEIKVRPAIEVVIEAAINDLKHAGKHTLLKTTPRIITVEPRSAIPLLIDNKTQVNLSARLFERVAMLHHLMKSLRRQKRKIKQSDIWLKLILSDDDLITAVFESSLATIDMKTLSKNTSLDQTAFGDAERFWNQHCAADTPAQSWDQYEQQRTDTNSTFEQFPAMMLLIQALHEQTTKGVTDD